VVRRFGKLVREVQPGLNYHLPYPIETALMPPALRVNKIDGAKPRRVINPQSVGYVRVYQPADSATTVLRRVPSLNLSANTSRDGRQLA
jgi:hypothetical protein